MTPIAFPYGAQRIDVISVTVMGHQSDTNIASERQFYIRRMYYVHAGETPGIGRGVRRALAAYSCAEIVYMRCRRPGGGSACGWEALAPTMKHRPPGPVEAARRTWRGAPTALITGIRSGPEGSSPTVNSRRSAGCGAERVEGALLDLGAVHSGIPRCVIGK